MCALIVGPCGTGKSHIAQAIGHEAVKQDYDVLFTTVEACKWCDTPFTR